MSNLEKIIDPRVEFYDEEREKERAQDSDEDSNASDGETKKLHHPSYEKTQADILSERTAGKLTGPKGVIADYRYAKKQLSAIPNLPQVSVVPSLSSHNFGNENRELDEFEDFSDDEFFKAYRQKRLQEISNKPDSSHNHTAHAAKPIFGEVFQLAFDSYNSAIDTAGSDIPVIIHLYETHILDCQLVHSILKELSLQYGHAKFCEIPASATGSNFDEEVLPTILVYKNSKLIANLVRFVDELASPTISLETVESVLLRYHALSSSDRKLLQNDS